MGNLTPLVGSDAWRGVEQLEDLDEESRQAATRCLRETKWENLAILCSSLHNNIKCEIREKFSIGSQHLVKLIEFHDGMKWVARISLLKNGEEVSPEVAASTEEHMASQIATYKYLKCKTNIPVPDVHASNPRKNVEVGAPYMVLTYIHGSIADDFLPHIEDPEEARSSYLLKQLAEMMVKLAACHFDRSGSIFVGNDSNFKIGKLLETDDGPYETAQEYYEAVSQRRFHFFAGRYFTNNADASREDGIHLPLLFNILMPLFTNSSSDEWPFCLANTDFGPHNVLVDENLNIVGLIDCDNIVSAPIHVVAAQIPQVSGMSSRIPGRKPRGTKALEAAEQSYACFEKFVSMVADEEKKTGAQETKIADAMVSDAARLAQGLDDYQHQREYKNADWVNAYWYMYYRKLRGPTGVEEFDAALTGYESDDDEMPGEKEMTTKGNGEKNGDDENEDNVILEGMENCKLSK